MKSILGAHAGRESEVHGNAIIITIMYYICGTCMYYNNHCYSKHVFNEHISTCTVTCSTMSCITSTVGLLQFFFKQKSEFLMHGV